MEGRSWAGSFLQRGRAPLPAFLFHCVNPGSSGPRPLLGVWSGLSQGGYSDPERWGRETGRERGGLGTRGSPHRRLRGRHFVAAPRPPAAVCAGAAVASRGSGFHPL